MHKIHELEELVLVRESSRNVSVSYENSSKLSTNSGQMLAFPRLITPFHMLEKTKSKTVLERYVVEIVIDPEVTVTCLVFVKITRT